MLLPADDIMLLLKEGAAMKIIDAHMHYFNIEGFKTVAANAGYENTAACWQQICDENNIVFSVAMGNTEDVPSRYGGISPRLIVFKCAV